MKNFNLNTVVSCLASGGTPQGLKRYCLGILFLFLPSALSADPRLSSWSTDNSGQYARLYETKEAEASNQSVATWFRGRGNQSLPTYADIHEISYSNDWVYIRTTGLASHLMGPWYLNAAKTNLFPNYPSNRSILYRIPRTPTIPINKIGTSLGTIGRYVNGVSMFDSRDAFSYSNSNSTDSRPNNGITGDGIWNRDAYVNESVTFDAGNAHQAGPTYHYHANPPGLRHQLGDSVDHDFETNTYTENFNSYHSPILGWAADGLPIYGPYAYSDANNPSSTVRRMVSGYQKRDGTNGTTNLAAMGRTTLPAWAATFQNRNANLSANQQGPPVNNAYVLGRYIEDYDFLNSGDLDQHNGRRCVTPEFPGGTYAYFITIAADGTPVFPYAMGREYYGTPAGGNVNSITEPVTLLFEGGAEKGSSIDTIQTGDDEITLTWQAVEGGSYQLETSSSLRGGSWKTTLSSVNPDQDKLVVGDKTAVLSNNFYRVKKAAVAPYDDSGFVDNNIFTTTYTFRFSANPPLPENINSLKVGGQDISLANISSYDRSVGILTLCFNSATLPDGDHQAVINSTHLSENFFSVGGQKNILFLIIDDWGVDASPFDNPTGIVLPKLPNMDALVRRGLRFTRCHSQPLCSPTRATILTGRHPFEHTVGNPSASSILPTSELTLPEIFTAQNSRFEMASYGKWHLGGTVNAPSVRGGWPEFAGIRRGGVTNYTLWDKLENGTTTEEVTSYTTTDQVNEGTDFIVSQGTNPWFLWMAFNAPHTPFHSPPSNLAPVGGYSTSGSSNSDQYIRALEALDTEIGRLLTVVDLNRTNVIVIGDNGTPGQVVQAPFGNGHAKGDLYQGGIHVPLFAVGPDIRVTGTTDKLVHCVDLFSTILDLGGIDESAATVGVSTHSQSLLPIFHGIDTASRCVIAEKFGDTNGNGRALISDVHPDYKLIIFGDKDDISDTPIFELYNLPSDANEQTNLLLSPLSNEAQSAYDHLLAKDLALGGGYSDSPAGSFDTIYIELPNRTGPTSPPNNLSVNPTAIMIDGQLASFVAREDSSGTAQRYWVKCSLTPGTGGPFTSATVTFPNNPNTGGARSFNSTQIITNP